MPEWHKIVCYRTVEVAQFCALWFVARDVATALGYADPAKAVSTHCRKSGVLPEFNKINGLAPSTK
ncbi:BRO family protein [Methylomonas rosea]|uniref:BRO family protein n=1 Tax=Methylomonas rosea TaxID=2952227 RepID=A0ABT1TNG7_9GAMM|nr:BRO family protein [Methylomonas sp. WSC-7]